VVAERILLKVAKERREDFTLTWAAAGIALGLLGAWSMSRAFTSGLFARPTLAR
jgi:hypothetical protein